MPGAQLAAPLPAAHNGGMVRLLKYLPVVIPIVAKFVKSPRGQRMIQSAKSRVSNRSGGPTSRGR